MAPLKVFTQIFIVTALLLFLSCSQNEQTTSVEEYTQIVPSVSWRAGGLKTIPTGVDSIKITITSPSLTNSLVKTFPFSANKGTISGIPEGAEIAVTLDALDTLGKIVYTGTVQVGKVTGAKMEIPITADQVTPLPPSELVASVASATEVKLAWKDNSSNENKFVIFRSSTAEANYSEIGASIEPNYTDENAQAGMVYRYIIRAQNNAGISDPSDYATVEMPKSDNSPPEIAILSHDTLDTVNTQIITLYGEATDSSGIARVFTGATNAELVQLDDYTYRWMFKDLQLLSVNNKINISIIDNSVSQNQTDTSIKVIYNKNFVDTTNHPPYFVISPIDLAAMVRVGEEYLRVLKAVDQDKDDTITYSMVDVELTSDTIRWVPTQEDIGIHNAKAYATDKKGAKDSISWVVTVVDSGTVLPNRPPTFVTKQFEIPKDIRINNEYSATIVARDLDNDPLTFDLINGANLGITIETLGNSCVIRWTPTVTGNFPVKVKVSDPSQEFAEIQWLINVFDDVDLIPPTIQLLGDQMVNLLVGEPFQEYGYQAFDMPGNVNLTDSVKITILKAGTTEPPLDSTFTQTAGQYNIIYSVKDQAGNEAQPQIRQVRVEADMEPPVLQLNGMLQIELVMGQNFTDPGGTAWDNVDGDLTDSIKVSGDSVNTMKPGMYSIKYNVQDNAGNKAPTQTRTVNVRDNEAPVITLIGTSFMSHQAGVQFIDPGVKATDNADGDITSKVKKQGFVNINALGTYDLRYNVQDNAGNMAPEILRRVQVIDTIRPVITLLGSDSMEIELNSPFNDPGARAVDNFDGTLNNIQITGNVDPGRPGRYVLTYNVQDNSGNTAIPKTRIVIVLADKVPPTLTLNGAATMYLKQHEPFNDPGANAFDNIDGNINHKIQVSGSVDMATPGTYILKYNVCDNSNNCAPELKRTVVVQKGDVNIPVITLKGPQNMTLYVGDNFFDEGATAWDQEEGDISHKITVSGNVNVNAPGIYYLKYNVCDNSNNCAKEVIRKVEVLKQEPVLGWAVGNGGLILELRGNVSHVSNNQREIYDDLYSVHFVDRQKGFVGGEGFYWTNDSGNNWNRVLGGALGDKEKIKSIYFNDNMNGWIAGGQVEGQHMFLRKTTDGGNSWQTKWQKPNGIVMAVQFINIQTGFAVVNDYGLATSYVLKTTDGGETWQQSPNAPSKLLDLDIVSTLNNGNVIWAAGPQGTLFRGGNNGQNWSSVGTATHDYQQVSFGGPNSGWVVANSLNIYKINGVGDITATQFCGELMTSDQIISIQMIDNNLGAAGTLQGNLITTEDGGNTWKRMDHNDSRSIQDFYFYPKAQ